MRVKKIKEVSAKTPVKVTISRIDDGVISIVSSHPLPNIKSVIPHLGVCGKIVKSFLNRHEYGNELSLEYLVSKFQYNIGFQEWTDAIVQATLFVEKNGNEAVTESKFLLKEAYIAYEDAVYKLSPVKVIGQAKALALAKKKATDKAFIEAKSIITAAKETAEVFIASAKEKRQEAANYLEEVKSRYSVAPPVWAIEAGIPVRLDNKKWYVSIDISFCIHWFDIGWSDLLTEQSRKYSWRALMGVPKKVLLWVPVNKNGAYGLTGICVDKLFHKLPHISHSVACMSIPAAPETLKCMDDLQLLGNLVQTCMSRVQLDSLRVPCSEWVDNFSDFIPPDLLIALKDHRSVGRARELAVSLLANQTVGEPLNEVVQTNTVMDVGEEGTWRT